MGYSNEQLAQLVQNLTQEVNRIKQKAKTTDQFQEPSGSRENSLIRVYENGQSEQLSVKKILSYNDHMVRFIMMFPNWDNIPMSEIQSWVNTNGLTVEKGRDVYFKLLRFSYSGAPGSPSGLEEHIYRWWLGEGEWGPSNNVQLNCAERISIIRADNEIEINIGEIGSTATNTAVNQSGTYYIGGGQTTIFSAERNGEEYRYLYLGTTGREIGIDAWQTTPSEFADITDVVPEPIDTAGFVDYIAFDNSMYNAAGTSVSPALANFTSLTRKFYFLKVTGENTYYFASKTTNDEYFIGSQIFIRETGESYDLGDPATTQNGYNFWNIGNLNLPTDPMMPDWHFDFWLKNKDDPNAVKFISQVLTEAQRNQARANLDLNFTAPPIPNWAQQLIDQLNF